MFQINLLGSPSFAVDGRPHTFLAPPKTLPLLALLVMRSNAPVARETLAGLLWPDIDEEDARANLRRHLHYLQQALPPGEWLIADRKTVRWNVDAPCTVDVVEFERLSKYAQLRPAAVDLYRGDLLAAHDDEVLFYDRDRLRMTQLNNLSALAAEAERARNAADAGRYARALLDLDPWREDAVRIVMRARMQSGDRAGALAAYEQFRARLAAELDVAPDSETQALYTAFSQQKSAVQQTLTPRTQPAGRASELDTLLLHWRMAESGKSSLVLVAGEAGAGKTHLLAALADETVRGGGEAIAIQCTVAGASAYESLADALNVRSALPQGTTLTFATERGSVFAAFANAVSERAKERPVLLSFEDLHWASADFIALIEFLERRLRGERALIVGTYRDDAIAPEHPLWAMRRAHNASANFAHVTLAALDRSAAGEIARQRLGQPPDDALLDTLYTRSGGNALFLTQLLEYAVHGESGAVPQSVRALVHARANHLSRTALELALVFAAAGRTLPPEVAAKASAPEGRAATQELLRTRFLREEQSPSGTTYAFAHDLVREALYQLAAEERVTAAHARLAAAFAESGPQFAGERAYHLERCGDKAQAAREYVTAAAHAAASFANDAAERFAQSALTLTADAATRFEAYDVLVSVYHRRADRARQMQAIEAMLADAQRLNDSHAQLRALMQRLSLAFFENDEGVLTGSLLSFAALIPDEPVWKARLHLFESASLLLRGLPQHAWEKGLRALEMSEQAHHAYGQLFCCVWLLQFCDGFTRPYAELLETGRALERDVNDPDAAALLAGAEARIFLHVDRSVCAHAAMRLLEAGERSGSRSTVGVAHMYLGAIDMYRFEPDDALRHFQTAQADLSDAPQRIEYARLLRFLGLFRYAAGDVAGGIDASMQGLALARDAHGHELMAICAANVIYGMNVAGRFDEAVAFGDAMLLELQAVRDQYFVMHHLMTTYGRALCELGENERGIRALLDAYEVHRDRRYHLQMLLIGATAAYYMVRAGRIDEARPFLEEAENGVAAMIDEGFNTQECLWLVARALHASGERERAQALLETAASLIARHSERFADPQARDTYLQMALNRAILTAHSERRWPTL